MKKLITMFSLLLTVFSVFSVFIKTDFSAYAAVDYMRVITADTPIYEDESMTKFLFFLPYTYYVKVLSISGDVAHIEYAGNFAPAIDGYTLASALFSDGLTVENPYLSLSVKTCKTSTLYKDALATESLRYVFSERSLYYYGFIRRDEDYIYCVSYNGNLGYVKEDCLYPFTIPDHPNELTFIIPEPEEQPTFEEIETDEKDNSFVIRIVVIGCLVFAGLIAIFSVKKPKKPSGSYYDESDYG